MNCMVTASEGPSPAGMGGGATGCWATVWLIRRSAKGRANIIRKRLFMHVLLGGGMVSAAAHRSREL
jgi:hypothetical protein